MTNKPLQKILFGSPGTGKSNRIKTKIIPNKLDIHDQTNIITTVFHPEYTYGDFMGKLMPLTDSAQKVSYRYYTGHFLKALGKAYRNIIDSYLDYDEEKKSIVNSYKREIKKGNQDDFTDEENQKLEQLKNSIQRQKPENVVLIIDELNRGNSAAIFGIVFQLLDRDRKGWSEYSTTISDLEKVGLLEEIGFSTYYEVQRDDKKEKYKYNQKECSEIQYKKYMKYIFAELEGDENISLLNNKIKMPPNLSILATMNTSDNSIYFMDNAFKRRWDWEFIHIDDDNQRNEVKERKIKLSTGQDFSWPGFVDKLNQFICDPSHKIRKVEDKQIGYFFINEDIVTEEQIKNKLMFFVWDSVFGSNREPLAKLLGMKKGELVTFGQFTREASTFVEKIMA